jgi:Glycoside Hydrolase Family 113
MEFNSVGLSMTSQLLQEQETRSATELQPPLWLVCAALAYPTYWSMTFLLRALPAFIRVAFFTHQLAFFECTFRGVRAATFPTPLAGGFTPSLRQAERDPLLITVPLMLVVIALLLRMPKPWRPLYGFGLATAGWIGASPWLSRWTFSATLNAAGVLALVFFFAVQVIGLFWFVGWDTRFSARLRLRHILAAWVFPMSALTMLLGQRFLWQPSVWQFCLGGLAAIIAAVASNAAAQTEVSLAWPGWRGVAACTLSSLCLFGLLKTFGASSRAEGAARVQRPVLTKVQEALAGKPYERTFFQKGVNFTAEWPDIYGSDGALHMLARMPGYGVNAIALVPFGFMRQGSTEVRFGSGWESDSGIEQVAAFAHSFGTKVMLKPQIWVRPGYPGDLEFTSETERRAWFTEYQRLIEHYAGLAKRIHADLLCVGVEFTRLTRHEVEWRRLIARVRELYPGPLVYAANAGEEFENLHFWDALDYIGLDNYYSLPDDLNVSAIVEKVEAIHRHYQRPVIFTEVGFSSLEAPHRQPWDETPRRLSTEEQARCYEAVFRAFYRKPWFQGMYWWKVGSNGYGGPQDGTHTPWGKPAMEVVSRWYRNP